MLTGRDRLPGGSHETRDDDGRPGRGGRCWSPRSDRGPRELGAGASIGRERPTKLTVWVGWSARELSSSRSSSPSTTRSIRDVTIKVVGGINDDKIIAALRSGNAPGRRQLVHLHERRIYCPSGGWIDLAPYLKKDHIDIEHLPGGAALLHAVQGQACALPLLADAYGLYYNKTLFKKAGITRPPKTFSELTADAKKLTSANTGRLAQGRRVRPESSASTTAAPASGYGPLFGAKYFDDERQLDLSTDPGWAQAAPLGEEPDRLLRLRQARPLADGPGTSSPPSHAFEKGKLAMMLDGEWRVAFIKRRSTRTCSTAPRRCRSTTPSRSSTAPATSTGRSSASRRPARTTTRRGSSSST